MIQPVSTSFSKSIVVLLLTYFELPL